MRILIVLVLAAMVLPAPAEARRPRTYDKPGYLMPEHPKDQNYNTAAVTQNPFEGQYKPADSIWGLLNEKPAAQLDAGQKATPAKMVDDGR